MFRWRYSEGSRRVTGVEGDVGAYDPPTEESFESEDALRRRCLLKSRGRGNEASVMHMVAEYT